MIALVLHDPCVETAGNSIDRISVLIITAITQTCATADHSTQAGHTEATFPGFVGLGSKEFNLGIHQHGHGNWFGIGIARV